jgi:hypothetical protein
LYKYGALQLHIPVANAATFKFGSFPHDVHVKFAAIHPVPGAQLQMLVLVNPLETELVTFEQLSIQVKLFANQNDPVRHLHMLLLRFGDVGLVFCTSAQLCQHALCG